MINYQLSIEPHLGNVRVYITTGRGRRIAHADFLTLKEAKRWALEV